ncbi:MAG: hypothetical protein P8Y23_07865 [Candidatus Lokiarchaeota archaeon]
MVKIDYEFRKKVMDAHIIDTLKYCYQCNREMKIIFLYGAVLYVTLAMKYVPRKSN